MPEALTESFCERCGTRYEFAAPTTLSPLRKTRGLMSGLKNYIMSQDALSDSIGDAMRSEEGTIAARQMDAFHASFNFCIDCRQYTCLNCWNDTDGRCRSCAPVAGSDDLAERMDLSFKAAHPEIAFSGAAPSAALGDLPSAWPSSDLAVEGDGRADLVWPAEEIATTTPPEPEPFVVAEPEPEPEPFVVAEPIPAPAVVAWQDDTRFELLADLPAEVEAELESEPVVAAEPVVAVEPEPEPVVVAEPEPIVATELVATAEPEPRPAPSITSTHDTILRMPQPMPVDEDLVAARFDDPAVAARRAQLDLLGLGDPGEGPLGTTRPNVLPYRSSGASPSALPGATRAAQAGGSFWDASAREVAGNMSSIAVQSCGQCGLSLSASARFCRRCGTRQAQSA